MAIIPKSLFSGNKGSKENTSFEENVKSSFQRAREHINKLEDELKNQKERALKQDEQIKLLLEKIGEISKNLAESRQNKVSKEESSTGNQGVWLDGYSTVIHSTDRQKNPVKVQEALVKEPKLSIASSFKDIEKTCKNLSKQQLLAFLTLYELEEELGNVSYIDLAKKMRISEGCVRTYIASLIKKGMPIMKKRYNNRIVLLSVFPEFRKFDLGRQLTNIYYESDPLQRRLVDKF